MRFITQEDEEEEYVDDESFYRSAPAPAPGHVPGDPRPSGFTPPPPPPFQGPPSSAFPPADDPPRESSFAEDWANVFFPILSSASSSWLLWWWRCWKLVSCCVFFFLVLVAKRGRSLEGVKKMKKPGAFGRWWLSMAFEVANLSYMLSIYVFEP